MLNTSTHMQTHQLWKKNAHIRKIQYIMSTNHFIFPRLKKKHNTPKLILLFNKWRSYRYVTVYLTDGSEIHNTTLPLYALWFCILIFHIQSWSLSNISFVSISLSNILQVKFLMTMLQKNNNNILIVQRQHCRTIQTRYLQYWGRLEDESIHLDVL